MIYYLILPGDTNEDVMTDFRLIGESSGFGKFWTGGGWQVFKKIVTDKHDIIEQVTIKDQRGKEYSPMEFLDQIDKLVIE